MPLLTGRDDWFLLDPGLGSALTGVTYAQTSARTATVHTGRCKVARRAEARTSRLGKVAPQTRLAGCPLCSTSGLLLRLDDVRERVEMFIADADYLVAEAEGHWGTVGLRAGLDPTWPVPRTNELLAVIEAVRRLVLPRSRGLLADHAQVPRAARAGTSKGQAALQAPERMFGAVTARAYCGAVEAWARQQAAARLASVAEVQTPAEEPVELVVLSAQAVDRIAYDAGLHQWPMTATIDGEPAHGGTTCLFRVPARVAAAVDAAVAEELTSRYRSTRPVRGTRVDTLWLEHAGDHLLWSTAISALGGRDWSDLNEVLYATRAALAADSRPAAALAGTASA